MWKFDRQRYGPACAALLAEDRLSPLGPGSPDTGARSKIEALDDEALFSGAKVVDRDMAACCRSGLWLLYDDLHRSHSLSQEIKSATGSYWHGIMHRREPDYSNAKYWFRRVGEHAIFDSLCTQVNELAVAHAGQLDRSSQFLGEQSQWDPYRFIDLCEAIALGRSRAEHVCRLVAQAEWRLLFDYCYRSAIGQ